MPDMSKVMVQIKKDTLVLQIGVGRVVDNPTPKETLIVEKLLTIAAGRKASKIKDLGLGTRIVLSLYRSGTLLEDPGGVGRPVTWLHSAEEDLKTMSFINFRRKS
jgi:hypothetical protein